MKKKLFGFLRSDDRRGLALITVLGVVTLATILILALFSVSDAEFKSSQVYSAGANARRLADDAVNIVIGQIQSAATGSGVPGLSATGPAKIGETIWASQPGGVRVYRANGTFVQGRSLFSSRDMIWNKGGPTGEKLMAQVAPAANWASTPDQWVDLNHPVQRLGTGGVTEVHFPIFDPRAAPQNGTVGGIDAEGNSSVEEFEILTKTTGTPGVASSSLGVVLTGTDTRRLPMPVEWLYICKDGAVGTVAQNGAGAPAIWVGAAGSGPTVNNPIIGRVGFWTDDECCKININTAGEPGFWSLPTAMHDRERAWADSPPALFEYQRYPGHPATVCLSSVFAPTFNPRNYFSAPATYPTSNLTFKNDIYDFVPKLSPGGTSDGQLPFTPNDIALAGSQQSTPALAELKRNIMRSFKEPLYPSVDEALFITDPRAATSAKLRSVRSLIGPTGSRILSQLSPGDSARRLERLRPFLTAHSRAPETNMFGLPRVAIWPVPDTVAPSGAGDYTLYRTGYDTAVALCAKVGTVGNRPELEEANSYYFRRLNPSSHLTDMGRDPGGSSSQSSVVRNPKLMTYLNNLIHLQMPGGSSFNTKYGLGDAQQILVEIFDYIRCTNLYDGFKSEITTGGRSDADRRDQTLPLKLSTPVSVLWDEKPARGSYYTYTPPRFSVKRRAGDAGLQGMTTKANEQYNQNPEWVPTGTYPGHGQVRPIEWNNPDTGKVLKGFGRFPTISEVGLQFICTGDGTPDAGSWSIPQPAGAKPKLSGGKTAERVDPDQENVRRTLTAPVPGSEPRQLARRYWYSNLPPYPGPELFKFWGCDFNNVGRNLKNAPDQHPGFTPENWNCTLDYGTFVNPDTGDTETGGIPLREDEMRIQVCLLIETFVPAVGYTRYTPDFTMVLRGDQVSGIKVKNSKGDLKSIFSTTDPKLAVQSTMSYGGDDRGLNAATDVSPLGGFAAPSALTNGRQLPGMGRMPRDPNYVDKNTDVVKNLHSRMLNFPLVSDFITVQKTKNGSPAQLHFTVESPLKIDIYCTHDYEGAADPVNGIPVQTVNVQFPPGDQTAPTPQLVVYSNEKILRIDSNGNTTLRRVLPAPHWWAFNYGGAVNRYVGNMTATTGGVGYAVKPAPISLAESNSLLTYGRFHGTQNGGSIDSQGARNGNGQVPLSGLIYGYSSFSTYSGVMSSDQELGNIGVYNPAKDPSQAGVYKYFGSDMVRSLIPRHGDYRIFAAQKEVDAKVWERHPVWKKRPTALFAHSFSGAYSDAAVGFDLNGGTATNDSKQDEKYRLVPGAFYETATGNDSRIGRLAVLPDTPLTLEAAVGSARYRDFDNGPGNLRDGPYINKPDDGNLGVMKFWHGHGTADRSGVQQGFYQVRNTYFQNSFLQLPSSSAFFTPNRMISSPGMFGSLPTGVWGSQARPGDDLAQYDGIPWRTLLFRADIDGHVGAAPWSKGVSPADHYFMDLFFMPIVEPYAITDAYSTAGKINLNYQIIPFTHIRRATAVAAALKGEMITAYSSLDTDPLNGAAPPSPTNTAIYKKIKDINPIPVTLWNDTDVIWHREINVHETLKQFDERFEFSSSPADQGNVGLMLSPSQICEVHLVPNIPGGTAKVGKLQLPAEPSMSNLTATNRKSAMKDYWAHNDLTGDNTRERPYANLYQKFTTRSNTFRVYFTAQTLKKARSVRPNEVDTRKDTVTSEYRGSALFERYLDMGTQAAGAAFTNYDYGTGKPLTSFAGSLEGLYHYRVIEMKQFSP